MNSEKQKETHAHDLMKQFKWNQAGPIFEELAQNNFNPAINYYNAGRCFQFNNEGVIRGSGANLEKSKECFQKAISKGTNLVPDSLLSIALIETSIGNFSGAEILLDQAKSIDPNNFQIHGALGWVYNLVGKYKEAVVSTKNALNLNPNDCDALINLAIAFDNLNDHGPALVTYKLFCEKANQIAHLSSSVTSNIPIAQQAIGRLIVNYPNLSADDSKLLDVIQIKPNIYGIGLDLNALIKKIRSK